MANFKITQQELGATTSIKLVICNFYGCYGGWGTANSAHGFFWDWVVLFNFGNSNNDTSGVAAAIGIRIVPPERLAYFYHPTGWPSVDNVIPNFHM